MQPAARVPAPSATLLRFLKSQSRGIGFFNTNPTCFTQPHQQHALQPQSSCLAPSRRPHMVSRCQSTLSEQATILQASYLNLDFLWPRATRAESLSKPTRVRRPPQTYLISATQRHASTDRHNWRERHTWLRKLLLLSAKTPQRQKLEDLPLGAFLEDSNEASIFSRAITKAANEPRLRCTEFDENGNVVLVNGEFKKSELIAKYGLLPRDLRKIDSSLLPLILVRPSAILINLLHIRCLIKHNRVLVFDAYGSTDSYTQSVFMYDLEGKLGQKATSPSAGGLPYEFRALEAVLISVTSGLEAEFEIVREPVVRVLRALEEDIDRDKLRHLLVYSKKLGTFEQKAKLVRDAIDELLDADDDLAAMYLTEKAHDIIRGEDDHTEVEMLLESYHKISDEIVQASGNLISNIRNTEEIVRAILDANRNSLMLLDLKFSIGTLGMGSGAFIAALYGMNLKNYMEDSDLGFATITALCATFVTIVCIYCFTKLRKVQRVSMWGEGGRSDRSLTKGSWRDFSDIRERQELAARIKEKKLDLLKIKMKEGKKETALKLRC